MYTLLAGSPPFWHRKQMLMLRMIMNGDYKFGSPEWDDQSDTVKDLVGDAEARRVTSRAGVNISLSWGSRQGSGFLVEPAASDPPLAIVPLPLCLGFHHPCSLSHRRLSVSGEGGPEGWCHQRKDVE